MLKLYRLGPFKRANDLKVNFVYSPSKYTRWWRHYVCDVAAYIATPLFLLSSPSAMAKLNISCNDKSDRSSASRELLQIYSRINHNSGRSCCQFFRYNHIEQTHCVWGVIFLWLFFPNSLSSFSTSYIPFRSPSGPISKAYIGSKRSKIVNTEHPSKSSVINIVRGSFDKSRKKLYQMLITSSTERKHT